MKYYIPTTSLNFNNILSTESLSPKAFYDKRGFGYSRWFTVEENCIEYVTLLYDAPHMFKRPISDIEDHPMLLEIDTDEIFNQLAEGIFYTDRTIYLNPWQTKFIFFSEKDRTTAISLSDSSLETKLVRLYKRKIYVYQFEGTYPIVQTSSSISVGDINKYVEDDYVINKMKGLLYGYYIGANLSSTKEYIQKLDSLREIQNIFSSVLSSYDKVPSNVQRNRLNELFDYLDSLNPIYADLEKEVGNKQLVDRIFSVFKRYGYVFSSINRSKLICGLQEDGENNQSVAWINREITHTRALIESSITNLNPDDGEIIVSSKDKVVAQKAITDSLLSKLFTSWTNDVFCSKSFNGKVNSIKEGLSDEITKSAKNVIGVEWDNSPIRTYLNQLRRHVRGEEFNQLWDNGLLSSISAILIKGDEWEQLLNFMQSKGMYDYRIAFAFYGVLNGFANLTRDFTNLLLNKESNYVSKVYREIYGQLFDKSIPETSNSSSTIEQKKQENHTIEENVQNIVHENAESQNLREWQNDIRKYAMSIIKRDKQKLITSLEEALAQNGNNQDYYVFLTMLNNFKGWKPTKNGPSTAWKRMQEHYVPNYDQFIGEPTKKQGLEKRERGLFDGFMDGLQQATQTVMNALSGNTENVKKEQEYNTSIPIKDKQSISRFEKSILDDKSWIYECAALISDSRANKQFIEDMEWFVENHNKIYNDKKKGVVPGYYADHDKSNRRVLERLRAYMDNKLKPRNKKMQWLADIYANIPINKIVDYILRVYGI